mmetsp:Transcript_8642/g.12761  ORF Transcript_8642/g.12761 Transcript_8642/m.12761 type:complete len:920 (+) Transcript_8642:114-2873(+)
MSEHDPEEITFEELHPSLLNEENKALSKKVKEQEQILKNKEKERDDLVDRISILEEHLKAIKTEVNHTQVLVNAKNKDIEAENHFRQVAEREIGRLNTELKQYEKEFAEIQDKLDTVQNEIFRNNEKLDKFKLQMNFNQEELEQWTLAEKQKQEDFMAVERYQRKDEKKIKELTMLIEKLTRTVKEKRREYENEVTETQASQIELDKTAEDFQKLHKERQELVKQWEDAIEHMRRLDEQIRKAGEKFADKKSVIRDLQDDLFSYSKQLELILSKNKDWDAKIAKAQRQIEKSRTKYDALRDQITSLNDEIEVVKNTLTKASTDLSEQRGKNKNLLEQKARNEKKQKQLLKKKEEEENNLKEAKEKLGDLEAQSALIEKRLKEMNQQQKDIEKSLREAKDKQYKESEELYKVRQEQANFVANIGGTNAQNKNLKSKILQMDNEAYKQQELLYNIGFQIQNMERKVHRAQGNRTEEEKERLNSQIEGLQSDLDSIEQQHYILSTELKKVRGEVRKIRTEVAKHEKETESLRSQVNELSLENESHIKELAVLTKEKEEELVNHDVLKLSVTNRAKRLSNRAEELEGLENRKNQLELQLQEREQHIEAQKAILVAELKAAEQERRTVSVELSNRKVQIDKLKNKFEILLQRLQPQEGDKEVSQAEFLVQAIQKREELQRKGDMLDAEIQEKEKQEAAIRKTLKLFRERNANHLSNFRRVDPKDPNYQKKVALEARIKEINKKIALCRANHQRNQQLLAGSNQRLEEHEERLKNLESSTKALTLTMENTHNDLNKLQSSIQLKARQRQKFTNTLKDRGLNEEDDNKQTTQLKDVELTQRKYTLRQTMMMMSRLIDSQGEPSLANTFRNMSDQFGLSAYLDMTGSQGSSRQSSARSYRSGASSSRRYRQPSMMGTSTMELDAELA